MGKRFVFIGFILSILLTLFVNSALLMRVYGRFKENVKIPLPHSSLADYFLHFSLAWFFFVAFILYIGMMLMHRWGYKLFKRKEYKVFLLAIGVNVCIGFALTILYPAAQSLFMNEFVTENRHTPMSATERPERSPFQSGRPDFPRPAFRSHAPVFLPIPLITEHLFVIVTVILFTVLLQMLNSRQQIAIEYEQLKTKSLQSSYNALMGQVNPHFFFNSLNGLSSLIRSDEKEKTLVYVDKLSDVFRYILQSNKKELVELGEELQFVRAYIYLLEVRYEGKLFFSMQVDTDYLLLYLPILSILPLVENAVKHNVISKQSPLRIDIYTTGEKEIVVSNNIQLRVDERNSNGLGLKNLWGRYQLLTGNDIRITNHKGYFKVFLPLQNNRNKL